MRPDPYRFRYRLLCRFKVNTDLSCDGVTRGQDRLLTEGDSRLRERRADATSVL